jgi:hypothetical protein
MARVKLLDPDKAEGRVREVFERVKAYYHMVPGLQKVLCYLPETTDALWSLSLATAVDVPLEKAMEGVGISCGVPLEQRDG